MASYKVKVQKIGNGLGLYIPKDVCKELNISKGDVFLLVVKKGRLIYKRRSETKGFLSRLLSWWGS